MAGHADPGGGGTEGRLRVLEGLIPLLRDRAHTSMDGAGGANSLQAAASRDTLRNSLHEVATLYEITSQGDKLAAVFEEIASLSYRVGNDSIGSEGVEVTDAKLYETPQDVAVADAANVHDTVITEDLTAEQQGSVVEGSRLSDRARASTNDSLVSANDFEPRVGKDQHDEDSTGTTNESTETDLPGAVTCRHCSRQFSAQPTSSFAGLQLFKCPECGKVILYPLTRGWRTFWWIFAILTAVTGVWANVTLHQGYSWIPKGVGILSFVMLFWDVGIRYRVDRAARAVLARVPGVQKETGTAAGHPDAARPGYVAALTATAMVTLLVTVLGAIVITGVNAGYDTEIVDRAAGSPTQEFAGFDLVDSEADVCGGGQDYWACTAMHNTMWNALCTGSSLNRTAAAERTCDRLRIFIDDASTQYATCGYGCETRAGESGRWGWSSMRPSPTFVNVPGEPEITHVETCYFVLGPIHVGYCPRP